MDERRHALIVGATGVVGRTMMQHLIADGGWDITAVSRRRPELPGIFEHVAVDLLDRSDTKAHLGLARGLTHVFYAAYMDAGSWVLSTQPNLDMLANLLDAVEPASPELRHINLMHGTKWYGSHEGPFKTPAKEEDPRGSGPNFYHGQQDLIVDRQVGKSWTWSAVRPHAICGFATGNPMNLVNSLAVYATLMKALGQPLCFPGSVANYNALYQAVDAAHLARAVIWMATEDGCANQAFNITNGDLFRWCNLWPRIASHFDMEVGPPTHISLVDTMPAYKPLWQRLVAEHHLLPIPYEQLVAWTFGDAVFGSGYDMISSMTKARQCGFQGLVDSEDMFIRLFEELRLARVIP
jgi:nucleoside-diphosphate-sugar epimerase